MTNAFPTSPSCVLKYTSPPGALANACYPALWEAEAGGSLEASSSSPAWKTKQHSISSKKKKIKKLARQGSVVLATWEAEEGGSLQELEAAVSYDHTTALQPG